ncbi:MAG: hypothetical protein ACRDCS_08745, partial [Tannerellaceae bacterium]
NHGREAFRGNEFYSDLADWEIAFSKTPKTDINPHPKGDEVKLTKQMFEKYNKINTLYLQDSAATSAISTDGNFEYKN